MFVTGLGEMQLVLTRGFIPVSWHSGKGLFNLLRKNTLQYVYSDVNSENNSKHCLVTICPLVQSLINGMKITSHFLRDLKLPFPFLPLLSSSFIPSSPPSLPSFLSLTLDKGISKEASHHLCTCRQISPPLCFLLGSPWGCSDALCQLHCLLHTKQAVSPGVFRIELEACSLKWEDKFELDS